MNWLNLREERVHHMNGGGGAAETTKVLGSSPAAECACSLGSEPCRFLERSVLEEVLSGIALPAGGCRPPWERLIISIQLVQMRAAFRDAAVGSSQIILNVRLWRRPVFKRQQRRQRAVY